MYSQQHTSLRSGRGSNFAVSNRVMHTEEVEAWYLRGVDAICYGLVVLFNDVVAVCVGNALLVYLVGSPEVAEEMISQAEQASIGFVHCAPAA
jgi:hypothetical protein